MTGKSDFALAVLSACLAVCVAASAAERKTIELDKGWRFAKAGAESGQQAPQFNDTAWQRIDIPHTWNRIGGPQGQAYVSDAYSGAAWYRLTFEPPSAGKADRYFLQFDGVGTIADVWLNGHYLGKHEGSFARFRFDATEAVLHGKANVLVVKADNSIPAPGSSTASVIPLSGDFFKHGGIYRKVALIVAAPQHIDLMNFGGPGVYARAHDISDTNAKIELRSHIANDLGDAG
jgi:beta-galactosidase